MVPGVAEGSRLYRLVYHDSQAVSGLIRINPGPFYTAPGPQLTFLDHGLVSRQALLIKPCKRIFARPKRKLLSSRSISIFQDGLALGPNPYGARRSWFLKLVLSAALPYDLGESKHSPEEGTEWEDTVVDAEPIVRPWEACPRYPSRGFCTKGGSSLGPEGH